MQGTFSGGCACGAIRYECSPEFAMTFNCHCRDCQRASGSAYMAVIAIPTPALTILTGSPIYNSMKADNGNTKHYGFCPACGSPLFITADEDPDFRFIVTGSCDDPSWFRPAIDIYTKSAQPWDVMNPALPKHEHQPTEEELQQLMTTQS